MRVRSETRTWEQWRAAYFASVSPSVRKRGREYFESGAVDLSKVGPDRVEATVTGSRLYAVELDARSGALAVRCTCPYFDEHFEWCKHIWATLLAANEARPDDVDLDDIEDKIAVQGRDAAGPRPAPDWKDQVARIRGASAGDLGETWPPEREIAYVVDLPATLEGRGLILEVAQRQKKASGEWTRLKAQKIPTQRIAGLPSADREVLAVLLGGQQDTGWNTYAFRGSYGMYEHFAPRFALSGPLSRLILPIVCATGRCRVRAARDKDPSPLAWDGGPPWEFWLETRTNGKDYLIEGSLRRGEETRPFSAASLLTAGGLVFFPGEVAVFDDGDAFSWVATLRRTGALRVPGKDRERLIRELFAFPRRLRMVLPEDLRVEEVPVEPRPRLRVVPTKGWGPRQLRCELSFDYGGKVVSRREPGWGVFQEEARRVLLRNNAVEETAYRRLRQLGARPVRRGAPGEAADLEMAPDRLPRTVRDLLVAGWLVEAEGRIHRAAGAVQLEVRSGIDWFELSGSVAFGDHEVPFPSVLAALRKGAATIPLGDGGVGLLPEDWLQKYGLLAALGTQLHGSLRFSRGQAGLLDALLADHQEATVDERFREVRERLRQFEGVRAAQTPPGFQGELRGYQSEGLGWLLFLEQFGLGGCLADDMGLGKTVQVLAFLESRREREEPRVRSSSLSGGPCSPPNPLAIAGSNIRGPGQRRPCLVVAPKSLVFNWKQEAARFAPRLKILDHTGLTRSRDARNFGAYDVVLTTYGTLRRDILVLKDVKFDYAILDEAQAIKNAGSESAKAARLLSAPHRLALSGTPVENHLGELWSLFEFLNPGMLGRAAAFRTTLGKPSAENYAVLARALKPFILRRTKDQVARDLPAKTEQTIFCELEPRQRKLYDELRDHYRYSLLQRVAREGIGRSKIHILEALLRLRQAACHPALIDSSRREEPGAKIETLLPQLSEVLEEGHKALVFSQFTSFLAILRLRLERMGIAYEYLDGQTRDREQRVRRFQEDPACPLFLVSLKAGGLGLNLTAAEYVFLLDPWWNPAVEAQAVDRAHRIGQRRAVFAYRLIAKDTVEEKVLALQQTKRGLADAILGADNSLVRDLRREDLDLLLS